ncbi:MAG: hypothetical protein U9Q73_01885 [Nanoarchaeota archaeon]|nr:hypothetical protein [Nanoarchaeota archaeon]
MNSSGRKLKKNEQKIIDALKKHSKALSLTELSKETKIGLGNLGTRYIKPLEELKLVIITQEREGRALTTFVENNPKIDDHSSKKPRTHQKKQEQPNQENLEIKKGAVKIKPKTKKPIKQIDDHSSKRLMTTHQKKKFVPEEKKALTDITELDGIKAYLKQSSDIPLAFLLKLKVMIYLAQNRQKEENQAILKHLPSVWGGSLKTGGGWSGAFQKAFGLIEKCHSFNQSKQKKVNEGLGEFLDFVLKRALTLTNGDLKELNFDDYGFYSSNKEKYPEEYKIAKEIFEDRVYKVFDHLTYKVLTNFYEEN